MFETILKHINSIVSLSPEDEAELTAVFKSRTLRKRQYLLQAGDICRQECFVVKGCLRAYYLDDKGQEHIGVFGAEEYWISDMYSLITGEPAIYNIDALEDSELILIEKNNLEEVLIKVPALERFFRIKLQRAFAAHQKRIIDNMSKSAEERYLIFQRQYAKLEQRLPQHQVASFLGITPESLSRIRRQLAERK